MPLDLNVAWEQLRTGDLAGAGLACRSALAVHPDRADALHLLGLVTLQGGDPTGSAELLGRAVALRPDVAEYHQALAEAHRLLGRKDLALDGCKEARRLRPDSPEILCNLGSAHLDQGDLAAAIGSFREALRLRPDLVPAHNNLAQALYLKGDVPGALDHLRVAARLAPVSPEAHSNLGRLLLELGMTAEALDHCREAIRLRPGFVAAHLNLGNALQSVGRLEEAASCYRTLIQSHPRLAAAHAGLAGVLEQLGDLDEALVTLREALRHDPGHAGALARLATRLRGKLPEAEQSHMKRLLADPGLAPDRRLPLLFGLAHVLDDRGQFDRAAELSLEANALQRAEFARRGRGYDRRAHTRFVAQILAAFTPDFFERVRGWGLDSERPVFVVGLPRSGTTLVEQILASHPRVFGAGELLLARQAFDALVAPEGPGGDLDRALLRLDRDALQERADAHLGSLSALGGAASRVVDKMPENLLYLGLIAAMFPRARVIHCRRDPRDVALSCWMTNFGQVRWACDIGDITSRIADYRRLMEHWRRVLPLPLLEIDYEALVADPEGTTRSLIAGCGLEWDPACLRSHETRRPVRTASTAQVRRPIHGGSVGRWKSYAQSLASLFADPGSSLTAREDATPGT